MLFSEKRYLGRFILISTVLQYLGFFITSFLNDPAFVKSQIWGTWNRRN
jgi:hypothetical protein